jgi:hypothetical protein
MDNGEDIYPRAATRLRQRAQRYRLSFGKQANQGTEDV